MNTIARNTLASDLRGDNSLPHRGVTTRKSLFKTIAAGGRRYAQWRHERSEKAMLMWSRKDGSPARNAILFIILPVLLVFGIAFWIDSRQHHIVYSWPFVATFAPYFCYGLAGNLGTKSRRTNLGITYLYLIIGFGVLYLMLTFVTPSSLGTQLSSGGFMGWFCGMGTMIGYLGMKDRKKWQMEHPKQS